jgi:hypothetical protein
MAMTAERATHDYTVRRWGHDVTIMRVIDGGLRLRAGGWGRGISEGDYLIMRNAGGTTTTRYRVVEIEYMRDPTDQWFADLAFDPRG